jgi:hypothetical protein
MPCKLTVSLIVGSYFCASISTVSRERMWGIEDNPHALLISALEAGVVSFTPRQLSCQEKSLWWPLYNMQRLPKDQTGRFGKKHTLLLSIIEPIILSLPAHSLVPVLPLLACRKECESKEGSSKFLNSYAISSSPLAKVFLPWWNNVETSHPTISTTAGLFYSQPTVLTMQTFLLDPSDFWDKQLARFFLPWSSNVETSHPTISTTAGLFYSKPTVLTKQTFLPDPSDFRDKQHIFLIKCKRSNSLCKTTNAKARSSFHTCQFSYSLSSGQQFLKGWKKYWGWGF